jgi:hypothetical protein
MPVDAPQKSGATTPPHEFLRVGLSSCGAAATGVHPLAGPISPAILVYAMQLTGWKKITAGVVATIILGALGSGLWETALRPSGSWIWRGILTAATLGSQSIKNQVYVEAAKGSTQQMAALAAQASVFVFTGMATVSGCLIFFGPSPKKRSKLC